MNIYIGNLSYSVTEDQLRKLFESFGTVQTAKVIIDKLTGNSKGFGFVEMEVEDEANHAIAELNDKEVDGRRIRVSKANPPTKERRDSRPPRRFNSYR